MVDPQSDMDVDTMDFAACGGQWNSLLREIFFSYSRKIFETLRERSSLINMRSAYFNYCDRSADVDS